MAQIRPLASERPRTIQHCHASHCEMQATRNPIDWRVLLPPDSRQVGRGRAPHFEFLHHLAVTFLTQVVHGHESHAGRDDDPVQGSCHEEQTVQHLCGKHILRGVLWKTDDLEPNAPDQTTKSASCFQRKCAYRKDDAFRTPAGSVLVLVGHVGKLRIEDDGGHGQDEEPEKQTAEQARQHPDRIVRRKEPDHLQRVREPDKRGADHGGVYDGAFLVEFACEPGGQRQCREHAWNHEETLDGHLLGGQVVSVEERVRAHHTEYAEGHHHDEPCHTD